MASIDCPRLRCSHSTLLIFFSPYLYGVSQSIFPNENRVLTFFNHLFSPCRWLVVEETVPKGSWRSSLSTGPHHELWRACSWALQCVVWSMYQRPLHLKTWRVGSRGAPQGLASSSAWDWMMGGGTHILSDLGQILVCRYFKALDLTCFE